MALKSWTLILILAALPAFAGSEPPFNLGDVVSAGPICTPLVGCNGFGVALYRRSSLPWTRFGAENFRYPTPNGPVTYSPALNRMILSTSSGPNYATLEILDTDGHMTPLLTLPPTARVTALAGVGREILAVVFLTAPTYRFELWRIAATDGTVIEQVGLPFSPPPLRIGEITSIDLGGDRCTLAYVVLGEVVHRYDICARRPLEDVATRPASAVHFLPRGILLVLEGDPLGSPCSFCPLLNPRLARYDREGRLVSRGDLLAIRAMALDPDGSTVWILGVFNFGGGLMAVNASSGAIVAGPWQDGGSAIAVAGEWRAAEQPVRERAARH